MKATVIIIWLLLGLIAVWRTYHGMFKDWFLEFGKHRLDTNHTSAYWVLIIFSPIWIFGGLITLICFEIGNETCWYYNIEKAINNK